jgi:type IV secretion system protein VirB5
MANRQIPVLMLVALLAGTRAARAQLAVIDVASLGQLISEVQTLEQQLNQARAEFQSITGSRGMQQLLAGTTRNYLPPDWPTLQGVLQGSGGYPVLTADLRAAQQAVAVLSPQQLAAMSPAASAQLQSSRQSVALMQSVSQQALANSSSRFSALQQLINTIASATDQKSILELQARITAEVGMLADEHTKLQALFQAVQAQQAANAQRAQELAVAGHGQFASRFAPQP